MNSSPMGSVVLLAFIILTIYAVIDAKELKWKMLNLLIILGFIALGLGIGWALGAWGGNMEIGAYAAVPLASLLGCVGAFGVPPP